MPFLELDPGRLFYDDAGRGLPLVLLHGAWASHGWWRWQIPELSRLYRVIAPDLRGHGLSSDFETACSVDGFAEDLAHLLSACGLRRTALIGWSMGGMVAMRYALAHPARVAALVLMGTRAHRNPAMKPRILLGYSRSLLALFPDLAAPRAYRKQSTEQPEAMQRWVAAEVQKMLSPDTPPEVRKWVQSEILRNPRRNYLQIARCLWGWEAGDALRELQPPTLILAGENDPWAPPRFSELLHDLIPDSRLLIVPGAGHYLAQEHASLVNARILGFLDEAGYR